MKARNVVSTGKLELSFNNGSSWTLVSQGQTSAIDYLDCGPVLHGDHVTPQPWAYNVARVKRPTIEGTEMWVCRGKNGNPSQPWKIDHIYRGTLDANLIGHYVPNRQEVQCYNVALGRLNEKVRGGLDISTALAESSQTMRMLNNIRKVERHFKRLGGRRWADEWLEVSYGWLPLASDLYGSANELLRVAPTFSKFVGSCKLQQLSAKGSRIIPTNTDLSGIGTRTREAIDTKPVYDSVDICKHTVLLRPPTSTQELARWTSLNPVSIAWELMPYSFVIDWLIDIGGYLRNVETSYLYNSAFMSGFTTTIWANKVTENIRYNSHGSGEVPEGNVVTKLFSTNTRDQIVFNRTIMSSYPLPRLPTVQTDFSWRRHISAAALLAQFLPRSVSKQYTEKIDRILGKRSYQTGVKHQYDFAELR